MGMAVVLYLCLMLDHNYSSLVKSCDLLPASHDNVNPTADARVNAKRRNDIACRAIF
jgi:hypothetical protein